MKTLIARSILLTTLVLFSWINTAKSQDAQPADFLAAFNDDIAPAL